LDFGCFLGFFFGRIFLLVDLGGFLGGLRVLGGFDWSFGMIIREKWI
jgi:hypothetical protein